MNLLIQRLLAEKPVITDGAWGTEFQKQGLSPGQPADIWNLERPDGVEALARAYVEAGSRVILTNTFQANRIALGRHGLEGEVERSIVPEWRSPGVRLANEPASSPPWDQPASCWYQVT